MTPETVKEIEALAIRANASVGSYDEADCEPYAILPEGHRLESLQQLLPEPARITRKLVMADADSFSTYVDAWKHEHSELTASQDRLVIECTLDGHAKTKPSWCAHTVQYPCPLSREWKSWISNDRKRMTQLEFAEFLEDHVNDVVEPMGAELLSLANQLQIIRKATFGSTQRLASGEVSFQYTNENETGTVEIPERITLGIPVFHGGGPYAVNARMKYRLREAELQLWFELIEPEKYLEDAFNEVVAQIEGSTDLNAYRIA